MSEQQTLTRDDISAKIALRAWQDDAFRTRVLSNANAVFEEEFQEKLPPGLTLKVIEDDAKTVHFVIPAKPSDDKDLSDEELEGIAGGGALANFNAFVQGFTNPVGTIVKLATKGRW